MLVPKSVERLGTTTGVLFISDDSPVGLELALEASSSLTGGSSEVGVVGKAVVPGVGDLSLSGMRVEGSSAPAVSLCSRLMCHNGLKLVGCSNKFTIVA